MSSTDCVEQKGIIEEVNDGIAKVNITSFSACASCNSKAACQMSESASKIVDVQILGEEYKKGDFVKVSMKRVLGLKATLLAYVVPFIIILSALIILTSIGVSENISGLVSLFLLVPYFLVIYMFRNALKKTFQFTLDKVN